MKWWTVDGGMLDGGMVQAQRFFYDFYVFRGKKGFTGIGYYDSGVSPIKKYEFPQSTVNPIKRFILSKNKKTVNTIHK